MDIVECRKRLLRGESIYDLPLRVVNYNRVSTDKEEQKTSLIHQEEYFRDMISNVSIWVDQGSYVDEGISGTNALKRESFLRMIEDAKNGCFDMIVTKEISRFARNTMDSIYYTQLLLQYGVVVYFLSDNINTIYPDSEFRLTLMASMAQDEVRKLSERVKFGIQRSIREEKLGGSSLYGYQKEKGKMRIIPEEAKVVEEIFLLAKNHSISQIIKILKEENHCTRKGHFFCDASIRKILKNPRYKGWYTANLSEVVDYKTHKKIPKSREEWILHKDVLGNIPPIISEELWDTVNQQFHNHPKKNKKYLYTSKLVCGEDHSFFIRSGSGKRRKNPVWQCDTYLRKGIKGCKSPIIPEKILNEKLISHFQISNLEEFLQSVSKIEVYKVNHFRRHIRLKLFFQNNELKELPFFW